MRPLVRWIAVAAYAAAIFWLSSEPQPLPFLPADIFALDKLLHAVEYAVLAALLFRALHATAGTPRHALALSFALASLYGASDEWHQSFVPNRSADPWDWASDAGGAAAGAALAWAALRHRGSRASIRT